MMAATVVECPFVVAVDTREQRAFAFLGLTADARERRLPLAVRTQRATLGQGDYSIVGMERWVAVERKSIEDLFSTLGRHRRRFERELSRLQSLQFAAVVVEAEWRDVLKNPPARSLLNPKTVFRSVLAWNQRFSRVHWYMMPGRQAAEATTFRLLERFWKDHEVRRGGAISSGPATLI
jgi:ERCC4-type nuclease